MGARGRDIAVVMTEQLQMILPVPHIGDQAADPKQHSTTTVHPQSHARGSIPIARMATPGIERIASSAILDGRNGINDPFLGGTGRAGNQTDERIDIRVAAARRNVIMIEERHSIEYGAGAPISSGGIKIGCSNQ